MVKGIVMLGLGVAAVGLARFFSGAIADERMRRLERRDEHDTTRWEGEGGAATVTSENLGSVGNAA